MGAEDGPLKGVGRIMGKDIIQSDIALQVARIGIISVTALIILLSAYVLLPGVAAQSKNPSATPTATPIPAPEDCWSGALSDDPLHCYVLEQAQTGGVIDVDALYEANGVLYIYLNQTEPVSEAVGAFFKEKSAEFIERWPDQVFYDHPGYHNCVEYYGTTYKDCLMDRATEWRDDFILPRSSSYVKIELREGGTDARFSEHGWAGYRQLWPAVTRDTGGAAPGVKFDISDVDTTNIPAVDCADRKATYSASDSTCTSSQLSFPGMGLVGLRRGNLMSGGGRELFAEVKLAADEDVAAARDALVDAGLKGDNLTLTAAKYSYEELWRWANVIERFSFSRGNTIGILWVEIGPNHTGGLSSVSSAIVFPLASLPEAAPVSRREHRTTIRVATLRLQQTVDALPRLLGQLNIPVDAVGMVIESYDLPLGPILPLSGAGTSGAESQGTVSRRNDSPNPAQNVKVWLLVSACSALAALILGSSGVILVRRRLRRPAS